MLTTIPFIGPAYMSRSVSVDCQRLVNLYPETTQSGTGANVAAFFGTPGLKLFATVGAGPIRGAFRTALGRMFVVSASGLYEVTSAGTSTLLGTLKTSSGMVSIDENGLQLCVVDGVFGYVLTLATNAFTRIADEAFSGASIVQYLDGYFVFNTVNTGRFQISGLSDGLTYDALDFASAEGNPDNIVSMLVNYRELWLFGAQTTEVFYNSGASDFPIVRMQGAFIEIGCVAPFSVGKLDSSVFWLGGSDTGGGVVYQAHGYTPTRISTHAIEYAIQSYGDISDAVAFVYQQEGHSFYVLSFPSANKTWCYDITTNLWHERAYRNPVSAQLERHRANCHCYAFSKHLVGDHENGNIYQFDLDTYTDNGALIPAIRSAPHLIQLRRRNKYNSFELDLEQGIGLDGSGQGTDPKIILDWSNDGGRTWSNEHFASAGKIGLTKTRAIWRRLGISRDRVFRVTMTDPVRRHWVNAQIDVEGGIS